MTDYEAMADAYRESKPMPIKLYSEAFTFLQMLGSVRDLAVLDVACGDGFHTCALKQHGAAPVIDDASMHVVSDQCSPLAIRLLVHNAASRLSATRAHRRTQSTIPFSALSSGAL